jgi:hypothetical protein
MYGVHFNVSGDSLKLFVTANLPVVALVLPKRTPGQTQQSVCLSSCKPFQRLHDRSDRHFGRDQHVYVVGHDYKAMEQILAWIPVSNRFNHHLSDIESFQIQWAGRGLGKKTIHCQECLARCCRLRKWPISGKTAMQTPGNEERSTDFVDVRQPASMKMRHGTSVHGSLKVL